MTLDKPTLEAVLKLLDERARTLLEANEWDNAAEAGVCARLVRTLLDGPIDYEAQRNAANQALEQARCTLSVRYKEAFAAQQAFVKWKEEQKHHA